MSDGSFQRRAPVELRTDMPDRIEALEAENKALREFVSSLACGDNCTEPCGYEDDIGCIARTLLAKETKA